MVRDFLILTCPECNAQNKFDLIHVALNPVFLCHRCRKFVPRFRWKMSPAEEKIFWKIMKKDGITDDRGKALSKELSK